MEGKKYQSCDLQVSMGCCCLVISLSQRIECFRSFIGRLDIEFFGRETSRITGKVQLFVLVGKSLFLFRSNQLSAFGCFGCGLQSSWLFSCSVDQAAGEIVELLCRFSLVLCSCCFCKAGIAGGCCSRAAAILFQPFLTILR